MQKSDQAIEDGSHALLVIKYMGEERVRYILAALVNSGAIALDAFDAAYKESFLRP